MAVCVTRGMVRNATQTADAVMNLPVFVFVPLPAPAGSTERPRPAGLIPAAPQLVTTLGPPLDGLNYGGTNIVAKSHIVPLARSNGAHVVGKDVHRLPINRDGC